MERSLHTHPYVRELLRGWTDDGSDSSEDFSSLLSKNDERQRQIERLSEGHPEDLIALN